MVKAGILALCSGARGAVHNNNLKRLRCAHDKAAMLGFCNARSEAMSKVEPP